MSGAEIVAVLLIVVAPVSLVCLRFSNSKTPRWAQPTPAKTKFDVLATGSSPAERQVAAGRKNVRVLNGLITLFNLLSAVGLAATIGIGLFAASESGNDAGEAILVTILAAAGYALVWLITWALISVSKNILGAVTESLALNQNVTKRPSERPASVMTSV